MDARRKDGGANGGRRDESGAWRAGRGNSELIGFAAFRIDGAGSGSEECITPEEVLFAFTQGAVRAAGGQRNPAIMAGWAPKLSFAPATVFLRTRRGLYRSHVRTLREFKSKMPAAQFDVVSQSVVANLREVDAIALGAQRIKTLAYAVEESELSWQFDLVVVGRDYLQQIRRRFGMPSRPRANP
jgi:hypothetical protein